MWAPCLLVLSFSLFLSSLTLGRPASPSCEQRYGEAHTARNQSPLYSASEWVWCRLSGTFMRLWPHRQLECNSWETLSQKHPLRHVGSPDLQKVCEIHTFVAKFSGVLLHNRYLIQHINMKIDVCLCICMCVYIQIYICIYIYL